MMEDNNTHLPEIERAIALKRRRIDILSLSPEKALDRILDYPQPAALVHSFPEEDLYFLIHDIGAEDALPLLALASHKQLDFILDQEIWEKGRILNLSLSRWFGLMLTADAQRFLKWLKEEKTDLLEFYLCQNIDLRVREHDQDPSEFGEDFETLDDVYYFRVLPDISYLSPDMAQESADGITEEFRETLIQSLLQGLAGIDLKTYQNILLESASLLPAESEEEAYRWRTVRLAEKGFLPFDEAIGIYQPMTKSDLIKTGRASKKSRYFSSAHVSVPLTPIKMLEGNNTFSDALVSLSRDERFNEIQGEFATLCNQIIVADQKIVRNKEDLQRVVKKACGYINIALDQINLKKPDTAHTREIILAHPLSDLFKVGYDTALSLKWEAQRWMKESWFSSQGLSLTFWGEDWMGVLGGLLIKKPLFFDNYETGVLYREFQSADDIRKTESLLHHIIACDTLLSSATIDLDTSAEPGYLSYKNLLLTLWVKHCIGIQVDLKPLTLDEFKGFYPDLWAPGKKPKTIAESMKAGFVDFLVERTGRKAHDILKQAGPFLEGLFNELEREFSDVGVKDLDPRLISFFLMEKQDL